MKEVELKMYAFLDGQIPTKGKNVSATCPGENRDFVGARLIRQLDYPVICLYLGNKTKEIHFRKRLWRRRKNL